MVDVDTTSFLIIVVAAAAASVVVTLLAPRVAIPVVVVELLLGILIGPHVLAIASLDEFTEFFGNLGLGMLFFFAGYEIDFGRIRGRPARLAAVGWALSLVLAYGLGGILAAAGVVVSYLYTGSSLATTAIGTLIPILHDTGELRTRFGVYLLGAGAAGEFGPILLLTLVLATGHPAEEAVILVGFVALSVLTCLIAMRSMFRGWPLLERTFEASSQLAIRLTVVLILALVALAVSLGLDLLLGGFVAGMITRMALQGHEVQVFESKILAVGYGFLIPFFFVTSGMNFDLQALFSSTSGVLKVPLFLALFLVVRGLPALVLYRGDFDRRDRAALGFFCSTQLPLVVAITTVAQQTGHMHSDTAAALVGAAIVSTLVYPLVGLRLRRDRVAAEHGTDTAEEPPPLAGTAPAPART